MDISGVRQKHVLIAEVLTGIHRDLAKQILRLMGRYPKMTVKEILYLIEGRIEGEKNSSFVLSLVNRNDQVHYDNKDNLERIQFAVWDAGKVKWEDYDR